MSSLLFQPCPLGSLTLTNRIVIAPMCQYSAQDGCATDWHLMHLGQMALSGAGLLIIEASAVEPDGRITEDDLGLWSDANEAALSRVLDAVRTYSGMPIAIQIGHAGRKASVARPWEGGAQIAPAEGGWQTVAPSSQPHAPGEHPPLALDEKGLARIRNAFADTARRAARLGLDAIEVHAAHGYLLHQFLTPLANTRTDAYGGSLENRMRFPLEVFDAVRNAFPADKPVGVRISASDWVDGGWDVEQSVAFTQALKARGAGYIHVSSGGASPLQQIPAVPGYQLEFAERDPLIAIRTSIGRLRMFNVRVRDQWIAPT
jgi:2,4-dienoyl-CoA reductase-like NADH-dependent reductase (Old Yellow Enzyme family)